MKQLIFAGLLSLLFPKSVTAQTFQEVNYTPEKTQFALFAPNDAKRVTLRIYEEGQGGKAVKTVKMKRTADEQWTTTVRGDLMGKFYTFDVGLGECPGVFAKAGSHHLSSCHRSRRLEQRYPPRHEVACRPRHL